MMLHHDGVLRALWRDPSGRILLVGFITAGLVVGLGVLELAQTYRARETSENLADLVERARVEDAGAGTRATEARQRLADALEDIERQHDQQVARLEELIARLEQPASLPALQPPPPVTVTVVQTVTVPRPPPPPPPPPPPATTTTRAPPPTSTTSTTVECLVANLLCTPQPSPRGSP